jgi:hypothetical protein
MIDSSISDLHGVALASSAIALTIDNITPHRPDWCTDYHLGGLISANLLLTELVLRISEDRHSEDAISPLNLGTVINAAQVVIEVSGHLASTPENWCEARHRSLYDQAVMLLLELGEEVAEVVQFGGGDAPSH